MPVMVRTSTIAFAAKTFMASRRAFLLTFRCRARTVSVVRIGASSLGLPRRMRPYTPDVRTGRGANEAVWHELPACPAHGRARRTFYYADSFGLGRPRASQPESDEELRDDRPGDRSAAKRSEAARTVG